MSEHGISSAIRIRGFVLELAGRVNKKKIKVLIDSGATGNFISDKVVTTLRLKIVPESEFEQLTLADGSVIKVVGYVQLCLLCGDYQRIIMARVFPNLHKEIILGMPWLLQENPTIDWTSGIVTIQEDGRILTLPLAKHMTEAEVDSVNLCSAKQMARWIRRKTIDKVFVGIIRWTDEEKEAMLVVVDHKSGSEVERAFHQNMPDAVKDVLNELRMVSLRIYHLGCRRYEWVTSSKLN